MGFLTAIGSWIADAVPTFIRVTKKVSSFIHSAAAAAESFLDGRRVLGEEAPVPRQRPTPTPAPERPDFFSGSANRVNPIDDLVVRIDQSKRKLTEIEQENETDHRKISLQIDVMELIISASTFERFTNNINLHSANLQTHLHTIKNTAGLLSDVNRQRVAVKALMQTVNHMINVLRIGDTVKPISGIDVNVRQGAISIADAYRAFEATKSILQSEIQSYNAAIDDQLRRVDRVRVSARRVPSMSSNVSKWLEDSVEPKLHFAKRAAEDLYSEISMMPRVETDLRRDLLNPEYMPPDEIS